MHILLSNDDGIHAEGLRRLREALREGLRAADPSLRITTVAPDREQSASSHALTLTAPLRVEQVADGCYSVSGTPTDCVLIAVRKLLCDAPPDVVVSGINHGPNMGEDVHYSGTVAAAMEGRILGVPGIAISATGRGGALQFGAAEAFVRHVLSVWLARGTGPVLLNVNVPSLPADRIAGVRVCRLGSREYHDLIMRTKDPRGRDYFWIGGSDVTYADESDTDFVLNSAGYITVTPLRVDSTDFGLLPQLRALEEGWPP
jgi:5'-nucleotidase